MMCFSEYQTIGSAVTLPVSIPFTIKNGIKQTKYVKAKDENQWNFLTKAVIIYIAVIEQADKV